MWFGNETSLPPAGWHDEPNYRGTWSILSSCLLTLSLCLWTALHINLPEHGKEHLQKYRKTAWLLAGLLAPELVAWNAWEQWREARKLTAQLRELHDHRYHIPKARPTSAIADAWLALKRYNNHLVHRLRIAMFLEADDFVSSNGEEAHDHQSDEGFRWTTLHSWVAVMGGFAFDTSSSPEAFLPESRERVTLTPDGLLMIAGRWPDLLPDISCPQVQDKSKSDGLVKLVVCWQAAWFCIQCIFRLSQGLSITLLELNVFGHSICALLIYLAWWDKPQDVHEPFVLSGEESDAVAALLTTLSPIGQITIPTPFSFFALGNPRERWYWMPAEIDPEARQVPENLQVASYRLQDIASPQALAIGGRCWTARQMVRPDDRDQSKPADPLAQVVLIDQATRKRLCRIHHTMEMKMAFEKTEMRPWGTEDQSFGPLVCSRISEWMGEGDSAWDSILVVPAILSTGLYGGLHATAWNAPFPSWIQQLFWRASSLTVASALPGMALFAFSVDAIEAMSEFVQNRVAQRWTELYRRIRSKKLWICLRFMFWSVPGYLFLLPLVLIIACMTPWYCICRGFLVVESFITLAYLSPADLQVASWSQYVPHIT